MVDRLYLSLWFPNFRLAALPPALVSVVKQFGDATHAPRVHAAVTYPISWNESPFYQRIYEKDEVQESSPERAVAAATEILHDDFAYEIEVPWDLWIAETVGGLDPRWSLEPVKVRVVGFGPQFDDAAYEQNGHVRLDFGVDTPFLLEELELDTSGSEYIKRNVQKLVDLTNAIQEKCGISSRLLWTESGENLAQRLIARLQRVN
ncbi:MAG: hypothetical protein WA510_11690 [Acidobacteriaceae bacterium]